MAESPLIAGTSSSLLLKDETQKLMEVSSYEVVQQPAEAFRPLPITWPYTTHS